MTWGRAHRTQVQPRSTDVYFRVVISRFSWGFVGVGWAELPRGDASKTGFRTANRPRAHSSQSGHPPAKGSSMLHLGQNRSDVSGARLAPPPSRNI